MDAGNIKQLTLLHTIRIAVEIGLYFLYTSKAIPEAMTFAGRNFDILAGISVPVVYYFAFRNGGFARKLLLGWNVISLLLLLNIKETYVLKPANYEYK